jgi:hypothetical protein
VCGCMLVCKVATVMLVCKVVIVYALSCYPSHSWNSHLVFHFLLCVAICLTLCWNCPQFFHVALQPVHQYLYQKFHLCFTAACAHTLMFRYKISPSDTCAQGGDTAGPQVLGSAAASNMGLRGGLGGRDMMRDGGRQQEGSDAGFRGGLGGRARPGVRSVGGRGQGGRGIGR